MLLTRSVAMVPCVIIAVLASNSLDYLDEYINVEQSLLVSMKLTVPILLHIYIHVCENLLWTVFFVAPFRSGSYSSRNKQQKDHGTVQELTVSDHYIINT